MPAKAGIQGQPIPHPPTWSPAFAGATRTGEQESSVGFPPLAAIGLRQDPCLARIAERHPAAVIDDKAGPLVDTQGLWMIECRGVQPKAADRPRPGLVDGGLQEVGAETAADKVGDQPEITELRLAWQCDVELEEAGWHAAHIQHEDLDRRV